MREFRVVVAGGREFKDYSLLKRKLNHVLSSKVDTHTIVIVCGKARGADRLGEQYAKEMGYKVQYHEADWDGLGKSAGYRRNEEMAKHSEATVAFWDGVSSGTKHMIDLTEQYGNLLVVCEYGKTGVVTVGRVNQDIEGAVNIRIDRSSILGNPWPMTNESLRFRVCSEFQAHMEWSVNREGPFRDEMLRIYALAKAGKNVNLQCWCAPKRCHGNSIKNLLDRKL
jgi:hypothetical protein